MMVLKWPHMILQGPRASLKAPTWSSRGPHNPQGAPHDPQGLPNDPQDGPTWSSRSPMCSSTLAIWWQTLRKIIKSKVLGNLMGRQGHTNGGQEELHHKHLNWTYQKPLGKSWNHEIMITDTWKTVRNIMKWWGGIESDTWWIGVAPEWSNRPSRNLCQPIENP